MNLFFHPVLLLQTSWWLASHMALCLSFTCPPIPVGLSFPFVSTPWPLVCWLLHLCAWGFLVWGPPRALNLPWPSVTAASARNWGGSLKEAVAVTISSIFKCGDPQKNCARDFLLSMEIYTPVVVILRTLESDTWAVFKKRILVPLWMVVWPYAIYLMFLSFCFLIYEIAIEIASISWVAGRIKCFTHGSA